MGTGRGRGRPAKILEDNLRWLASHPGGVAIIPPLLHATKPLFISSSEGQFVSKLPLYHYQCANQNGMSNCSCASADNSIQFKQGDI